MLKYTFKIYIKSECTSVALLGLNWHRTTRAQAGGHSGIDSGKRGRLSQRGAVICVKRDCRMEEYMGRGTNGREGRERD